eukprot:1159477-Pelagomonas_calceolata.AAC.5
MDGVKQGKDKCKLCEHVFHGGATRIRLHFLQVPGCGVAQCTAAEDKLEPVKKVMQQLKQDSRKKHRIGNLAEQRPQHQQHQLQQRNRSRRRV